MEDGFYWIITYQGLEPEPASFEGNSWWVIGDSHPFLHEPFQILGPLSPPDTSTESDLIPGLS